MYGQFCRVRRSRSADYRGNVQHFVEVRQHAFEADAVALLGHAAAIRDGVQIAVDDAPGGGAQDHRKRRLADRAVGVAVTDDQGQGFAEIAGTGQSFVLRLPGFCRETLEARHILVREIDPENDVGRSALRFAVFGGSRDRIAGLALFAAEAEERIAASPAQVFVIVGFEPELCQQGSAEIDVIVGGIIAVAGQPLQGVDLVKAQTRAGPFVLAACSVVTAHEGLDLVHARDLFVRVEQELIRMITLQRLCRIGSRRRVSRGGAHPIQHALGLSCGLRRLLFFQTDACCRHLPLHAAFAM